MVCHCDYSDAYFVAAKLYGPLIRQGLTMSEMARISRHLKRPLRPVHYRKVDLEEDAGILGVLWPRPSCIGHWVVLRRGTIIDPHKSSVWDADEYMKHYQARNGWLLSEN